jgi:ribonucleoside-triphosphate reductase
MHSPHRIKIRISSSARRSTDLKTAPLTEFERRFIEDEFISKENANIPPSVGSLADRINERLYWESEARSLLAKYAPEALILHEEGDIYIFKLPWCLLRIYCGSVKSQVIPRAGLKTQYTESLPPKHLDACVDQLCRAAIALSFEREGAVGLSTIDAALAPYLRFDEYVRVLGFRYVLQQIQRLFYTLNNIERPTIQTPFTNVDFAFAFSDKVLQEMKLAWAGKTTIGTAADYVEEMLQVFKAFCLMYYAGDAMGRPFTFPIPTVVVNEGRLWKILEEDPELWELFMKVTALRGSFYFLNTRDDVVLAFCCRLHANQDRVRQRFGSKLGVHGVWWKPGFVGSIDYVGINMPRLAWIARDEDDLVEKIIVYAEAIRKLLNFLRARHKLFYSLGWYPVTKFLFEADLISEFGFVPDNVDLIDDYYYNTIAVVGLAEAASIWILKNRDDYARECDYEMKYVPEEIRFRTVWLFEDSQIVKEILKFYELVLGTLRYVTSQFESEDEIMWNVEQAPAESASAKLARRDIERFGKEYAKYVPRDYDFVRGDVQYFYTSYNTPPYTVYSLSTQLYIEAYTQPLYTGGVTKILQIHEPFWSIEYDDPSRKREGLEKLERLYKLLRWILDYEVCGRKIVYVAYTPPQNHCESCGYTWVGNPYRFVNERGEVACPRCGSTRVETWSRIVGYYRPVRNWNPARRAEFTARLRAAEKFFRI